MKNEKSAGFVVFRKKNGVTEYLLLQNSSKFFWDFPKGNIGAGESEEDAAMRELEEEAGTKNVRLVPGFREMVEYFYTLEGERIHKTLVMFLGEWGGGEVKLSWEHSKHEWAQFNLARSMLKGNKAELLEKAHKFLSRRLDKWVK